MEQEARPKRESSQLAVLPGVTFEDIFACVPDESAGLREMIDPDGQGRLL